MAVDRRGPRIGAIVAGLIGLAAAVGTSAGAATLQIVDAALELNRDVQTVSFAVDDATGIEGFELTIAYDPAVVRIAGPLTRTPVTEGCLLVHNSLQPGTLRIALACLSPLQGAGPLLTVPLQAQAAGRSSFTIVYCRVNEQTSGGHPVGIVTVGDRSPPATFASSHQ